MSYEDSVDHVILPTGYVRRATFTIVTTVETTEYGVFNRAQLSRSNEIGAIARNEDMATALCLDELSKMFKERARQCRTSS